MCVYIHICFDEDDPGPQAPALRMVWFTATPARSKRAECHGDPAFRCSELETVGDMIGPVGGATPVTCGATSHLEHGRREGG